MNLEELKALNDEQKMEVALASITKANHVDFTFPLNLKLAARTMLALEEDRLSYEVLESSTGFIMVATILEDNEQV